MPCVYFISDGLLVKIGYTDGLPLTRLAELQTGNGRVLKLIGAILGDRNTEKHLHSKFAVYRQSGEWFDLPPNVISMIEDMPVYDQNTLTLIAQEFYGFRSIQVLESKVSTENDPVTQFLDTCLEYDVDLYEKASYLYSVYSLFDQNCVKFKTTDNQLAKRLKPALEKKEIRNIRSERKGSKGIFFTGCRLKPFEDIRDYLHFRDVNQENDVEFQLNQRP